MNFISLSKVGILKPPTQALIVIEGNLLPYTSVLYTEISASNKGVGVLFVFTLLLSY